MDKSELLFKNHKHLATRGADDFYNMVIKDPPEKQRKAFEETRRRLYEGAMKLPQKGGVKPGDVMRIADQVAKTAYKENLDPGELMAQVYQESRFDKYAVSRSGAKGVSQLMPHMADAYGVEDPRIIEDAIPAQGKIMREAIEKNKRQGFGESYAKAQQRYNVGGPRFARRERAGRQITETAQYPAAIEKWKQEAGFDVFPEMTYSGGNLSEVTVTALHPRRDPGLMSKRDNTKIVTHGQGRVK